MDPLFPELPEDLSALSDEDLTGLLTEYEAAADLVDAEDEQFLAGIEADDVLAQYEAGVAQIEAIRSEQDRRVAAQEEYLSKKDELAARRKPLAAETDQDEDDEAEDADEPEDPAAKSETVVKIKEEVEVEQKEPALVASTETKEVEEVKPVTPLRRPPSPSAERQLQATEKGAVLIASAGLQDTREGTVLEERTLASAMNSLAIRQGPVHKSAAGGETKHVVATAVYNFPPERHLQRGDLDGNKNKIRQVVPAHIRGVGGLRGDALVASGGLCAPLEPLYSLPNFASMARPVRDALPSFQAARGGVSVPSVTTIGDIDTAISVITADEDALGGTFATKSCQAFDCAAWTDVAVTVIAHCREYGNLNSRAWPEGIEHENALTMAAHARTAEQYLLDRIKVLSLNVTRASDIYNATSDLLYDILRSAASIRSNLRMDDSAQFRVLMPAFVQDLLVSDLANVQFDRFQARSAISGILARGGVSVSYYLDSPSTGTSQYFAAETASEIDDFPDDVQFALYPEGAFIHVDSGVLELGIVRDSSLNSTNDYQLFGESFENVARLAPEQAARWITAAVCPSGEFPALTTALSC